MKEGRQRKRKESLFYLAIETALNRVSNQRQEFTKEDVVADWQYGAPIGIFRALDKAYQGYNIPTMIMDAVNRHLDSRMTKAKLERSNIRRYLCYERGDGTVVWRRTSTMHYHDFKRVRDFQDKHKKNVQIRVGLLEMVMEAVKGSGRTFADVEGDLAPRIAQYLARERQR